MSVALPSLSLSFSLHLSLSILSFFMYVLSVSVCLFAWLCPSIHQPLQSPYVLMFLSAHLSVSICWYVCVCPFIYLLVCLFRSPIRSSCHISSCLSVCLYVWLPICLSFPYVYIFNQDIRYSSLKYLPYTTNRYAGGLV